MLMLLRCGYNIMNAISREKNSVRDGMGGGLVSVCGGECTRAGNV